MKLSPSERLALWNQYEILKVLNPEDTRDYELNQEILSSGFELLYSEISSIDDRVVTEDVSREVNEILNMFRAMQFSCDQHGYTPKSFSGQFQGFDGNESTGHFSYARFVRREQNLWDELSSQPDNSHSSTSLDRYREMLNRWAATGNKQKLTPDEIEEIAG